MKMNVTLHARPDEYAEDGFIFQVHSFEDMTCAGLTALDTVEVEFTLPPREVMVNGAVAAFRKKQAEIRAEAEAKAMQLENEIQRLLCIEHKQEAAAGGGGVNLISCTQCMTQFRVSEDDTPLAGKFTRCDEHPCPVTSGDHAWRWTRDWEGDPRVINGLHDVSRYICSACGESKAGSPPPKYDLEAL